MGRVRKRRFPPVEQRVLAPVRVVEGARARGELPRPGVGRALQRALEVVEVCVDGQEVRVRLERAVEPGAAAVHVGVAFGAQHALVAAERGQQPVGRAVPVDDERELARALLLVQRYEVVLARSRERARVGAVRHAGGGVDLRARGVGAGQLHVERGQAHARELQARVGERQAPAPVSDPRAARHLLRQGTSSAASRRGGMRERCCCVAYSQSVASGQATSKKAARCRRRSGQQRHGGAGMRRGGRHERRGRQPVAAHDGRVAQVHEELAVGQLAARARVVQHVPQREQVLVGLHVVACACTA